MIGRLLHARARPRPIRWLRGALGLSDELARIYTCQACYAIARGRPPHGWNVPCPSALQNAETYRARQDAERMAFIRQGQRDSEIGRANRLWAKQFTDDDD